MKKYFLFLAIILITQLVSSSQTVTLSTSPVAVSNITQGSTNNIVYIAKMDVTVLPAIINSIQFTLTGTHDANDLTTIGFYHNPTTASLTGATLLNNAAATFAAPHTYNINIFFTPPVSISAGATGYFIIAVNVNAAGTSGNTVKIDGAANPVTFSYTTSPTIINNQTDAAGAQTILAATVTLSTSPVVAANITQGSTNNIVYIVRMDVAALPVFINSIQFLLTGTHDANDLTALHFYHNATAPSLTGATLLNNAVATFAAPHAYNISIFFTPPINIAAGGAGYFIVTADVNAAGTSGNTVNINGLANPVTFSYTTSPVIINNQTDAAGTQTILTAGVTLTTSAIAASTMTQGSANNILYIAKVDVTALPVSVTGIQFTLTGTHGANDLTLLRFYHNPTTPDLIGATLLTDNVAATFAAPHTYNVPIFIVAPINIAIGGTGYFIVTANVNAAGTSGNTVKIDGAANPVVFSYTTSPPVTNNQTDAAGTQTIAGILPLKLQSLAGTVINKQEIRLDWLTTGELNTKNFEVEWSDDGLLFTTINVLPAAGNSNLHLQYSFIHKIPANGYNYYRLKMVDMDGRFTYSSVIKVVISIHSISITSFPNPVTDYLQLQITSAKSETIELILHSADGRMVDSKQITLTKGSNMLSWNLQHLSTGNYFISATKREFNSIVINKQR